VIGMGILSTGVAFVAGYAAGTKYGTDPVRNLPSRAMGTLRPGGATSSTGRGTERTMDVRQVREVMTATPQTISTSGTLRDAARTMADGDIGAVVVVDERDAALGILTDRDIVVRAVAQGRDPSTTKVGDVHTRNLLALAPTDTVHEAMRMMREHNVRRLPVVTDGRAIGMVSMGDLAVEADPGSVLADMSASPPNN
jgi:signal-transduction protein with cAMP-binding, CBS, and nucleotidyltransferase domain